MIQTTKLSKTPLHREVTPSEVGSMASQEEASSSILDRVEVPLVAMEEGLNFTSRAGSGD